MNDNFSRYDSYFSVIFSSPVRSANPRNRSASTQSWTVSTRFSRGRINNAKEDLIILTHDHRSSLIIFHRAADLATISCGLCRTFRIPLEFRTRPGECYQITRRSSNVTIASLRSWPSPPPPPASFSLSFFFLLFLCFSPSFLLSN